MATGKRGENVRAENRKLTGHSPPDPAFAGVSIPELEAQVDEYFDGRWTTRTVRSVPRQGGEPVEWEEEYMRPPTMAGLARHLGVTRSTLWKFAAKGSDADPIRPVIARALNRIAEYAEEALFQPGLANGAQFALRVNHGYGEEPVDEDDAKSADFSQVVTAPSPEPQKAIPKWEPGDGQK